MVQNLSEKITLADGNQIPGFGFGCYNSFGDEIADAVRMAVENGYRYIDSATFSSKLQCLLFLRFSLPHSNNYIKAVPVSAGLLLPYRAATDALHQ